MYLTVWHFCLLSQHIVKKYKMQLEKAYVKCTQDPCVRYLKHFFKEMTNIFSRFYPSGFWLMQAVFHVLPIIVNEINFWSLEVNFDNFENKNNIVSENVLRVPMCKISKPFVKPFLNDKITTQKMFQNIFIIFD